jgi:hypothetical protein
MTLLPLIDRTGAVGAWADRKTGWVCNPKGKVFALIDFGSVTSVRTQGFGFVASEGKPLNGLV